MPVPISFTLLLGAIAIALTGVSLAAWIMVGLALANETLRFVVLRAPFEKGRPAAYQIPAGPQPKPLAQDNGS